MLNKHQAITWTTDEQLLRHHMVSLGHTEFTPYFLTGNSSRCKKLLDNINHWGWMTHICVSKLTSIGSDNGLSHGQRQSIIWTIAGILLIGPSRTNFSEILIEICAFLFKKMHLKMARPQCVKHQVSMHNTDPIHIICSEYEMVTFNEYTGGPKVILKKRGPVVALI